MVVRNTFVKQIDLVRSRRKMPKVEYAKEIKFIPYSTSFAQLYSDKVALRWMLSFFGTFSMYVGLIIFFIADSKSLLQTSLLFVIAGFFTISFRSLLYFVSSTENESRNLIKNTSSNRYYLNMGKEVYEHMGDGKKSSVFKNLTGRSLLLGAGVVQRMGAILATTGAGKTWFIQGIAEQLCLIGGASFISDAKGTMDEFKRTSAIWYRTGREKTSFLINLLKPENSHAIDLFSTGTALLNDSRFLFVSSSCK
jgi:hypothetical protein